MTAYLDIETNYVGQFRAPEERFFRDSQNHLITVLGVRILEGGRDRFVQLVGEQITREALLETLSGTKKIVTYNGRSVPDKIKGRVGFDFPVIAAQLGVVVDRDFEHLDLVPECWQRNLYGGQKKIEQVLGLKRQLPGKEGSWAMETWRQYLATGSQQLLDELLLYNKEDVYMLREIELRLLGS